MGDACKLEIRAGSLSCALVLPGRSPPDMLSGADSWEATLMRNIVRRALALLLVVVSSTVWAQGTWPSRPIRFIVPFPPGGATDAVARLVGQEMVKTFGQQVLVENRGGGGGTIG